MYLQKLEKIWRRDSWEQKKGKKMATKHEQWESWGRKNGGEERATITEGKIKKSKTRRRKTRLSSSLIRLIYPSINHSPGRCSSVRKHEWSVTGGVLKPGDIAGRRRWSAQRRVGVQKWSKTGKMIEEPSKILDGEGRSHSRFTTIWREGGRW